MQNLKKFHRQIFKQTQDISILWSYFETQLRCHGNKFLKESTKNWHFDIIVILWQNLILIGQL